MSLIAAIQKLAKSSAKTRAALSNAGVSVDPATDKLAKFPGLVSEAVKPSSFDFMVSIDAPAWLTKTVADQLIPIQLGLMPASFWANADVHGHGVYFFDEAGTPLPQSVERWDYVGKTGLALVRTNVSPRTGAKVMVKVSGGAIPRLNRKALTVDGTTFGWGVNKTPTGDLGGVMDYSESALRGAMEVDPARAGQANQNMKAHQGLVFDYETGHAIAVDNRQIFKYSLANLNSTLASSGYALSPIDENLVADDQVSALFPGGSTDHIGGSCLDSRTGYMYSHCTGGGICIAVFDTRAAGMPCIGVWDVNEFNTGGGGVILVGDELICTPYYLLRTANDFQRFDLEGNYLGPLPLTYDDGTPNDIFDGCEGGWYSDGGLWLNTNNIDAAVDRLRHMVRVELDGTFSSDHLGGILSHHYDPTNTAKIEGGFQYGGNYYVLYTSSESNGWISRYRTVDEFGIGGASLNNDGAGFWALRNQDSTFQSFTSGVWVKSAVAAGKACLMSVLPAATPASAKGLYITNGALTLEDSTNGVLAGPTIDAGVHHVAMRYTASTRTIFVDGVAVASGPVAATPACDSFIVGSNAFSSAGAYASIWGGATFHALDLPDENVRLSHHVVQNPGVYAAA